MKKIIIQSEVSKEIVVRVRCVECSILLLFNSEDIFPFKTNINSHIIDGICRDCMSKNFNK